MVIFNRQRGIHFENTTLHRVEVIQSVIQNSNGYRDYGTNDFNWGCLSKSLRHTGLSVGFLIEFANYENYRKSKIPVIII